MAIDLTPASMTRAIVDNLNSAFTGVAPLLPAGEVFTVGQTVGYFSGIPFAVFNGTVRPRFAEDTVDAGIEEFIARARERKLPMVWQLTPDSEPTDIDVHLQAHGFVEHPGSIGMAVDLADLSEETLPAGLSIGRVEDANAVRLYVRVFCEAFGLPASSLAEPLERLFEIATTTNVGTHYLARLRGDAVGVCSQIPGAGVAGIYNVGTLTTSRGQGIGRAITLRALLDGRDQGYRVAVLHSSPMGHSVYRKLGFERYCDIRYFVWAMDSPPEESPHAR